MKKILVLAFCAFISFHNYAQGTFYVDDDFMSNYRNVKINTSKNKLGDDITGSPFTTDDFVLGTVIGYKNKYLLRYDAFNDHMLAKRSADEIIIINKEAITEVTFNDGTKYVVFDYRFDGDLKNGYLEVLLTSSGISLLKKEVIKYRPAEKPASGYDQAKPPAFIKGRAQYFIALNNDKVNSFSKKKDFLPIFPDKKKDIEKYIKANKIKFSKEQDLVKLVEYIGSSL